MNDFREAVVKELDRTLRGRTIKAVKSEGIRLIFITDDDMQIDFVGQPTDTASPHLLVAEAPLADSR